MLEVTAVAWHSRNAFTVSAMHVVVLPKSDDPTKAMIATCTEKDLIKLAAKEITPGLFHFFQHFYMHMIKEILILTCVLLLPPASQCAGTGSVTTIHLCCKSLMESIIYTQAHGCLSVSLFFVDGMESFR